MIRRTLLALIVLLLAQEVFAQPPALNGQPQQQLRTCLPLHKDGGAVNTTVTLTTPQPPAGQYVYVCGIDITVSNDGTGAVTQANVSFTSTNLSGWTYVYSSANAANTNGLDKIFYPGFALKAATADQAVQVISPAANTHAEYSINLYYYFAP